MTVTCPSCEIELAESKGSQYTCPDCAYEWTDSSTTIEDEEDEEEEEDEEGDEEEFVLTPAAKQVYRIIRKFLNEVSSAPKTHNISTAEADILNEMYDVLADYRSTEVNGSYNFSLQDNRTANMTYQEISITSDGLRLMQGGSADGQYGSDSYSDIIFTDEDENEEVNMDAILQFVRDMRDDAQQLHVTKIVTGSNY